jgi:photosystem I P700 chlorophyll a apoprotein A2
MWVSGNLFHIGWNGNYELWILNPIATIPIAHGIWDPHFASALSGESATVPLFSAIYNWLYALGFTNLFHLYNFVILCELLAVISLLLGKLGLISHEEFWFWLTCYKPVGSPLLHKDKSLSSS